MELPFRTEASQGRLPGGGDWGRTWPGKQGTGHKPVRGPVAPQRNGLEGERRAYSEDMSLVQVLGLGLSSWVPWMHGPSRLQAPGTESELGLGNQESRDIPSPLEHSPNALISPKGPRKQGGRAGAQNHPARAESEAQDGRTPYLCPPTALSQGPGSQLPGRRVPTLGLRPWDTRVSLLLTLSRWLRCAKGEPPPGFK